MTGGVDVCAGAPDFLWRARARRGASAETSVRSAVSERASCGWPRTVTFAVAFPSGPAVSLPIGRHRRLLAKCAAKLAECEAHDDAAAGFEAFRDWFAELAQGGQAKGEGRRQVRRRSQRAESAEAEGDADVVVGWSARWRGRQVAWCR